MRQSVPLRKSGSEARDTPERAERTSRSIDEWLAAAVAEQAKRAAVRAAAKDPIAAGGGRGSEAFDAPPPTSDPAPVEVPYAEASERPQASGKVADALGSVTSWIERAQEQLAATTRASQAAGERTTALVSDAIGAIGQPQEGSVRPGSDAPPRESAEALRTLERIEEDLAAEGAAPIGRDAQRTLESRIRDIAKQLDVPRRIGRRGMSPAEEIAAAVAEIRLHQSRLQDGPSPEMEPPLGATASDHASPKTSFLERPSPPQPARPSVPPADLGAPSRPAAPRPTRQAIHDQREAVEAPPGSPTRPLLDRSALATEDAGDPSGSHRGPPLQKVGGGDPFSRISRDIDVLSHKLDIVAASGVDPASIDGMARELGEIRRALSELPSPADIAGLADQIADLKADLARIGRFQVDAGEFSSLRMAFEDMRDALATRPDAGYGMETAIDQRILQASRDELQPIAGMLVTLVDKIERVERQVADPDALEQLERQIAGLTAAISDTAGRDPGLASLNHAMTELMSEVASWREGTVDLAERAARNAVAETLGSWSANASATPERELPSQSAAAQALPGIGPDEPFRPRLDPPRRTEAAEHRSEAAYEEPPRLAETPSERGDPIGERSADEALRRLNEALLLGQGPAEADRPLRPPPSDEILLEPGSDRPRATVAAPAEPASPQDARDVKASFIAAARRAALAAAADADKGKSGRLAAASGTASSPAGTAPATSLKGLLDRFRRPLLIGAASLVLVVGGYRLWEETSSPQPTRVSALSPPQPASPPVVAAPAGNGAAAPGRAAELPDPTTTQSVPPDRLLTAMPAPPPATDRPPEIVAAPESRETRAAPPAGPPERPASAGPAPAVSLPAASVPAASVPAASVKAETAPLAPAEPTPRPQTSAQAAPASARPAAAEPAGAPPAALRQAAVAGEPAALYEMASRTMEGRGVPRDARLAASMFEKAAEKNFTPAQYRLGNAYEKGVGVSRDLDQARRWYQRAAESGNTRAMHNLAVLLAEGAGGRPDYAGAIGWFQRAAEQGVRDSQFNLAVLFARGLGTSQDMVRSYTWFAIAAGAGDEEAGRKRDEVGARLAPTDLARAKAGAERWRVTPPNPAANEGQAAGRWSAFSPGKGPGREMRVGRA